MPIAFRHRDDARPPIPELDGLTVYREFDAGVMSRLQGRDIARIEHRFTEGHRAYVAAVHGVPAAWGWVATSTARIGEVEASFSLLASDRYLWNFVTLADFRGRGSIRACWMPS